MKPPTKNTNFEYRSPKQYPNSNDQNSRTVQLPLVTGLFEYLNIGILNLFRNSDFVFRILVLKSRLFF